MIGNIKSKNQGFTVIEALISAGMFIIIFVLIVDLAVIFTRHPEKIIRKKQIEIELSYAVEKISQKIRTSEIDYSKYSSPLVNPATTLHLINDIDGEIAITQTGTTLTMNSDNLTSDKVVIDAGQLHFFVNPTTDPFCDSYTTGSYIVCSSNAQPLVTISLLAHHVDDAATTINLQTTISSRVYER
jgi:hypothetical protein